MNLICWKGNKTTKFNSKYVNSNTKEVVMIVAGYGKSYIVYNGKYPHIQPTIDKVFDNRKSALNFAKSYMKKHDKC